MKNGEMEASPNLASFFGIKLIAWRNRLEFVAFAFNFSKTKKDGSTNPDQPPVASPTTHN